MGVHSLSNHLRVLLQVGDDSAPLLSQSAWFCRLLGIMFSPLSLIAHTHTDITKSLKPI